MRIVFLLVAIAFILCPALDTNADTGGSMGGGDWSSSSSSGGGYSGGGGYSSGGDYSSSSGWSSSNSSGGGCESHSSSGEPSSGAGGWGIFVVIAVVLLVGVMIATMFSEPKFNSYVPSYEPPDNDVDVTVLRVAVDGRSRKFVQTELARIAASADTKTVEGRSAMLREVALMLRRLRDAWVYGGAVNESMRMIGGAKQLFDKHVDDARSRFREETIRNAQGTITRREASDYTPRSDEGAGVILVTIVLAARKELFTVNHIDDGSDLRLALEAASQLAPHQLVAIEIIWQPSEDSDRLSSIELEAKYPRPDLHPIRGALVGKTFCSYCTAPYPAELVACPHCGAPARDRAA